MPGGHATSGCFLFGLVREERGRDSTQFEHLNQVAYGLQLSVDCFGVKFILATVGWGSQHRRPCHLRYQTGASDPFLSYS